MTAVGLIARCDSLFGRFGPSPLSTAAAVVGTALLALAIGVRTPQRFALWAAQVAWRRFVMRGRSTELSGLRLATRGTDRPLSWLVLSIIALLAGVLTAGVPVAMGWLEGFYEGMLSHFLWSIPPLAVLQAVIVFAAGCIPLGILGMGLSSLHRLSCPCGRWETRASAWVLIGAAVGVAAAAGIVGLGAPAGTVILTAALPSLFVSVVAAVSATTSTATEEEGPETADPPPPSSGDPWPRLLRVSIALVSACGGGVVAAWSAAFPELSTAASVISTPHSMAVAIMLLALGGGVLAGCGRGGRRARTMPRTRSIGGFGVACTAAGVLAAVGAGVLRFSVLSSAIGLTAVACPSLFAVGLAAAYGRQTLLRCAASRARTGAAVLARSLVLASIVVWIGVPVLVKSIAVVGTLTAFALFLLFLGGTLIVHEPGYSNRTRWARLTAVFMAVGTMIAVSLWANARQRRAPDSGVRGGRSGHLNDRQPTHRADLQNDR